MCEGDENPTELPLRRGVKGDDVEHLRERNARTGIEKRCHEMSDESCHPELSWGQERSERCQGVERCHGDVTLRWTRGALALHSH